MKKKLLILASIAPIIGFGQSIYMAPDSYMKVKPNTLVYASENFVSKDGSEVSNEGNINVRGDFKGTTDGTGFTNEWNSGSSYGQLIIKDGSSVEGKITGEYKFAPKSEFSYFPVAFPYEGYTSTEAVEQSGITSPNWRPQERSATRYKSPLFYGNNSNQVNDNILKDETLVPTGSYSINQYSYDVQPNVKSFVGKPNNKVENISLASFDFNVNNNDKNKYGEYYGSYIVDASRTMPSGWANYKGATVSSSTATGNYGSNIFWLGNPYTSNINFKEYLSNPTNKITAFILDENSEYFENGKASAVTSSKVVTVAPDGALNGDLKFTIVRPYQIFTIATQNGQDLNLNLDDSFKKFVYDASEADGVILANAVNNTLTENANQNSTRTQLGLELYHDNQYTGNKFFISAGVNYNARGQNSFEAYNIWLKDNVGFYTLQENEDGTVYEPYRDQKTYINAINKLEYVAKPVHLVFQGKNDLKYTLKSELYDLQSGDKFYFEDKKEGIVLEVTPEFEYTFTESNFTDDRFVVYWNGLPETMSTSDIDNSEATLVYKFGNEYGVKFDQKLKEADIYVYNLSGQLVFVKKSVNTSSDYTLPYLSESNVYIVKVVGDNGEITTKKIIK